MITILVSLAIGFVAGVYRDAIAEKAKEVYIKYSSKE